MNSLKTKDSMMESTDIESAHNVFEAEIAGLQALSKAIDQNFVQAVDAIENMKNAEKAGRVIITGIGKSGHVARKIAATMASTGTPAYFVHPGEASHGDLGMITKSDVVLMISNSGEAPELSDLIHYTRRFGIVLIAITSNPKGALAKHSDINLMMPKMPEACPNGIAPTTSTTMTMALGDALAMALLNRMGLTAEQFKVFHPGGKLGAKLAKVSEIMMPADEMAMVKDHEKMDAALLAMAEKNLGCVVIIDEDERLQGIITDGDLKRHMSHDLLQKSVKEIMSTSPKSIEANLLAVEALDIMTSTPEQYLTSLLVLDGDKILGLIRLQDCLKAGLA